MPPKPYQFQFSSNAERDFASFSMDLQKRILKKLVYFEKSDDPLSFAKSLIGRKDTFRFRVGDYRVITKRKGQKTFVVLLIMKIAHRKEVY